MLEPLKLPQARMYLAAAQWGIDALVNGQLQSRAFHFHIVGILASLRAVQAALLNHDRKLSDAHRRVIGAWQTRTASWRDIPELAFIVFARNQILKAGVFDSYAVSSTARVGGDENPTVIGREYDLSYYVGDVRHDLLADLNRAVGWCECELAALEVQLPAPS